MASISKRATARRRDGRPVVVYDVRWRERGRARSKMFSTEAAARRFRAQLEAGTSTPETRAQTRRGPTVADVYAKWTAARRVSRGRASSERSHAKHLVAALGHVPVVELSASDVRVWIAQQSDAGYASETISGRLRMLRQVLDLACDDDLVVANVAARVRGPKNTRPPLDSDDVLDPAEMARLLHVVPDRWRALVALLGYVGPRWSEALGVQVRDVDLLRRRIRLGRNVLEEVDGEQALRAGGKTRNADRWVPLPAPVVDALSHHLATYPANRDGLVFVGEYGASPYRSNFRRRVLNPALREAGLEGRGITMRQLRHTAASNMLPVMPAVDVARRMGHAQPSTTTDIYARFLPSSEDAATAAYEAHISTSNHRTTIAHDAGSSANG